MAYGGDGDRGPFLNTINWVFNAIAFVAVILRFGTHMVREKTKWEIDDSFIILAMAVNLARSICISVAISKGFGQHLPILLEESPVHTTALLRLMVIIQAVGLWTFTAPKLPVASLLVRLFGQVNRLAIVVYSAVGLLIGFATIATITTFRQCTPVAAQWDRNIPGHCWDRSVNVNLGYFLGALSASLDFAFALYAVVKVLSLNMSLTQKIVIASSMSLGFLACVVSIYKLTMISEIGNTEDPTWATVPLEVWNSIEGTVLIVSASLPLIRPVVWKLGKRLWLFTTKLSSSKSNTNRGNYADGNDNNASESGNPGSAVWKPRPVHIQPQNKDYIPLLETQTFYNRDASMQRPTEPVNIRDINGLA